jgi:Ca-activated chloride channel homolog
VDHVSQADHVVTRLTFGSYWPLALLLMIPLLWIVQRKTLADVAARHLRLSSCLRSLVVMVLMFAMMQPVIERSGKWLSVIYLLDVSQSASPSAIQSAISWIERADAAGHADHTRYMPFATDAATFDTIDGLKQSRLERSDTNIQRAVEKAVQNFAPHHLKHLVLITDGHETSGHFMEKFKALARNGVRVFTIPLDERTNRDVRVESVSVPPDVTTEEVFPVDVDVYSLVETTAEVRITHASMMLATQKAHLMPGVNRVKFEISVKNERGPVVLEVEVKAAEDSFAENNRYRTSTVVHGRPNILYVEGHIDSSKYLQTALTKEGFTVTVAPTTGLPTTVATLNAYDAIVLSDVAREALKPEQMRAIVSYVRDLGGGFVLAGGENNYGEGGYSRTEIERVLPVTFDTKKERPKSVAMVVVLDKSGSMGGEKIDLAKEASRAPLELLTNEDFFGVVAFDYTYAWAAPLQTAANRQQISDLISEIIAAGETNIFPALEAAYTELLKSQSEVKHIILLSDGRSVPADYDSLLKNMVDARITVSTIAVGDGADQDLLKNIADQGKGRTYYLENPSYVPQIFTKETQLVKGNTLREEPFKPVVKKAVLAFKGINLDGAPQLLGYVATRSKPTSEVLMESARKEPILARWQYGLGKTAVFTSDLKDRWAADWLKWQGYSKFWSQLVRETMRKRDDRAFDFRIDRDQDEAIISADVVQNDGTFSNNVDTKVRVVAPDQSVFEVSLNQVGPGAYRNKVPVKQKGQYLFRVVSDKAGFARTLEYSYPDEYHFYPPNKELLRKLSRETKGVFEPEVKEIFDTTGESTVRPTQLWPYFAVAGLVLFILDILVRRLRVFGE